MIGGKIQHTDILLDTNKKVGLEINNDNTKYMFMPCHQNAGQNNNIKTANKNVNVANTRNESNESK